MGLPVRLLMRRRVLLGGICSENSTLVLDAFTAALMALRLEGRSWPPVAKSSIIAISLIISST